MSFISTFLCRWNLRLSAEPAVLGRMQIDGRIYGQRFHLAASLNKTAISPETLNF
jgi:hypothetical protein